MRASNLVTRSWILLAAFAAQGSEAQAPQPTTGLPFKDVATEAGIEFRHNSAPEKRYILESMSGGVALLDYNSDGLLDIYFVNALTVDTASDPKAARSALYKNLGGMKFEDVTEKAGVGYPGWGMGACTADVDGDGHQDLYVTTVGPDRLYRNRGDGTFEDIADRSGITADRWSTGCGFADYDRDGDLDLFVARYVEVSLDSLPEFGKGKFCQYRGVEVQCGPRGLPGTSDLLFRNDGKGRFEEVSKAAGVSDPNEYFGLGIAWLDHDRDGWPDLFVANDSGPNFLYRNKKDGTFSDDAFPLGGRRQRGRWRAGLHGGRARRLREQGTPEPLRHQLLRGVQRRLPPGRGLLHRHLLPLRDGADQLPYVGWGTAFLDYDNDGWLDLIVVNGHVYPQLEHVKMGASAPYRQRKLFYRNQRDGTFEEVGESFGTALTERRVGRGLAVGDLDNDGRLDVVINDLDSSPQLLHNQVPNAGNWLAVALEGAGKLTDAIGATITVRTGDQLQTRLVRSGTSYLSQGDMRQHFGLGAAKKADSLEVLWPNGDTTRLENVDANQILVVRQK